MIIGASKMPTVAMAEKSARLIPKAELEIFQHSRHFPFTEEPDKFMRFVRGFLNTAQ
ncbi:MAG: alpha/beta hydrolase [Chloroflexi bacterium]|nr:alpha/beta hydrolase [Chloroflexota bacterium]